MREIAEKLGFELGKSKEGLRIYISERYRLWEESKISGETNKDLAGILGTGDDLILKFYKM